MILIQPNKTIDIMNKPLDHLTNEELGNLFPIIISEPDPDCGLMLVKPN
jgi:hypothetical protein